MWGAIGNALYQGAAAVGTAAVATGQFVASPFIPGEYPPANLPSNYPFKAHKSKEEHVDWCHGDLYNEYIRIVDGPEWSAVAFSDPEAAEGGDIQLYSRTQEVTHHFMKATFTLKSSSAAKVIDLVASESLAVRQKFGPNMEHLDYFDKPDDKTSLLYTKFWAPPPTAGRDFIFVQGKKHHDDGSVEVWGCSVHDDRFPESSYVRGASFWGWRVSPRPDGCFLTYFNASDPRGWCPSWIFSFIKTQVSKDLLAIRSLLSGKEVKATKVELSDCGISAEDIQREQESAKPPPSGPTA
jgi:hypothetical protein